VQRIYSGSGQRLSSEAVTFRNQVRFQIDCQQQEFWLGPVFRWFPLSWLSCSVSPRGNLLYSDMELKRQEKLWQISDNGKRQLRGSWLHKKDGRRLLLGTSICCTLESDWENGFFAGLSLSASWYPENLEMRAGPGRVSLRPGTLCAGAIFGYKF